MLYFPKKKKLKPRVGDVMIPLTIRLQRHRSRHVSGIPNNLYHGSDDVPRQGFSFDLNPHGPERKKEDRQTRPTQKPDLTGETGTQGADALAAADAMAPRQWRWRRQRQR
jgi:hypothetical protein